MLDGDAFCGECGAPPAPEAPALAETPPEVTTVGEQTPAPSCPNGHANPEGNTYCGTCGRRIHEAPGVQKRHGRRRWPWIVTGAAVVALVGAVVLISSNDGTGSASGPAPVSGTSQKGRPGYSDVDFGECSPPSDGSVPDGARLKRAGAVVTDTYVFLVAETKGSALMPYTDGGNFDPQDGDWQVGVDLELWEEVGDHDERLYSFRVGDGAGFGGLDSKSRGKGLIDPAKMKFFRDGNYVAVLIERSALSALDDVKRLDFVAHATPQMFEGGPRALGWFEHGTQWCPNSKGTIPVPSFG